MNSSKLSNKIKKTLIFIFVSMLGVSNSFAKVESHDNISNNENVELNQNQENNLLQVILRNLTDEQFELLLKLSNKDQLNDFDIRNIKRIIKDGVDPKEASNPIW